MGNELPHTSTQHPTIWRVVIVSFAEVGMNPLRTPSSLNLSHLPKLLRLSCYRSALQPFALPSRRGTLRTMSSGPPSEKLVKTDPSSIPNPLGEGQYIKSVSSAFGLRKGS